MAEERLAAEFFESADEISLTEEERTAARREIAEHEESERCVRTFLESGREVCLSSRERRAVLTAILPEGAATSLPWHERLIEGVNEFLRFGWALPAFCLFLILTTVGATYASADSLPGEFLYSLKRVGEQIQSGLRLTSESRAEGEQHRMERRVREVEKLQSQEKLTENIRATLDQEFRQERRAAIQYIQDLEGAGNAEASSRLRARLNALEDQFNRVVEGDRSLPTQKSSVHQYPTVQEDASSSAYGSSGARGRTRRPRE